MFLQSGSRAVDGVAQSLRAESNDHRELEEEEKRQRRVEKTLR